MASLVSSNSSVSTEQQPSKPIELKLMASGDVIQVSLHQQEGQDSSVSQPQHQPQPQPSQPQPQRERSAASDASQQPHPQPAVPQQQPQQPQKYLYGWSSARLNPATQSLVLGDKYTLRNPNTANTNLIAALFDPTLTPPTLYHYMLRAVQQYSTRPCLGFRQQGQKQFMFFTYAQTWQRIHFVSSGIRAMGLKPGEFVGLYSKNRVEWQLVDLACQAQSMCSVALYDTLGEDSLAYIANQSEFKILFVEDGKCLEKIVALLSSARDRVPLLSHLVCFDTIPEDRLHNLKEKLKSENVRLMTFLEFEQIGKQSPFDDVPPQPQTLCTLIYTSGTTGEPKGVMISHANMIASITGIQHAIQATHADVYLSYLPLAHVLERAAEALMLTSGAAVGFYAGDIKHIKEDILALRPTLFAGVPRVFDRMYDNMIQQIGSLGGVKKNLVLKGMHTKARNLETKNSFVGTPIFEKIVYKRLRNKVLGGRIRCMLSGGAPMRAEVQRFLQAAFNIPVVQGYGLSETTAAGCIQIFGDCGLGRVGAPLVCTELKLRDVPQMGYLTDNVPPRGELLIRGPNVSSGYYKQPELTREAFLEDGWFATGDIAQINPDGSISIIDRCKNIVKLAQGEFVCLELCETKLSSALVQKTWLYGDSLQSSCVAICAVKPEAIVAEAKKRNLHIEVGMIDHVCAQDWIREIVLQDLINSGKRHGLQGFELPRAVTLIPRGFEEYEGCMTPAMKIVRHECRKTFAAEIDRMYKELKP